MSFVQLSDVQLQEMDLTSLKLYAAQVSSIISQEISSVNAIQIVQNQYDYMILDSQSTINGLGYEITTNSNLIVAGDIRSNVLVQSNALIDKTIENYNSTITGQYAIMTDANTQISSLTLESEGITSTLIQSDMNFKSSATYYSTLYMDFMAKDMLYQTCLDNISTTSTMLMASITAQQLSYTNWQTSSAYTVAKVAELSTLYLASDAIQSTLTQYKIDEIRAIANLASTNSGIMAISSLYATSLVNQQYYQTLSSQTGVIDLYTMAYSTFQEASALSNASPTNSVVVAAATMAQQRLSTLTTAKSQLATQVTSLQGLVAGAVTDSYAAQMESVQMAVRIEVNNISTFQAYANSSIEAVTRFSSLYEQAGSNIASSLAAVKLFSSFYESSITASNAFMTAANADIASIASQQAQVDAISLSISSMNVQYINYTSSYTGWVAYSTLMTTQISKANADLITYSSFYESTVKAVGEFSIALDRVNSSIVGNTTTIRTQSTILQAETINKRGHEAQIATCFTLEENAVFQYRETYVRQKLQDAQRYYDACILQQVVATSTQNGNLIAQAGGSSVTPVPININTATINSAYTILTNISAFLNTFGSMYGNYSALTSNLQNVSTSIGDQRVSYTSLTNVSNAYATDPTQAEVFFTAQRSFQEKEAVTGQLQANAKLMLDQINSAKTSFFTTYNQTFLANEIITNETTISSFLIQGFNSAVIPP
jgi:hypothetical protein